MKSLFTSEVIYDSKNLRVGLNKPYQNLKEGVIFLTFDGIPGGFSSSGFGTEFLAKNGYVSLHVTCEKNTSYQNVSPLELLEAVSKYLDDAKVFLYGSSVGGYAALYFSSNMKGIAIAFSPLCPPDPVLEGAFKSGSSQTFLHTPLSEKDNSDAFGQFIIYDPLVKYDCIYFNERVRPAFPNAKVFSVPNGQHSVARTLLNNSCLKSFLFNIIDNSSFPLDIEIDPLRNPVSYGKAALKLMQKDNFDGAYKILKKYNPYGHSSYSETAVRKLFFDRGYSFEKDELILSKYRKNLYFRKDEVKSTLPSCVFQEPGFYINLAKIFSGVFDFHAAKSIVNLGLAYYPGNKELKSFFDEIERYISKVE